MTESYGRTTKRNRATIRRSLLSVHAFNQNTVEKALFSEADAILLDLDDAVTPDEKAGARQTIARAVKELDWRGWRSWRGRPTLYRANALDTPSFYRDLIEVVEATGDALDAVIIPKINRLEDLHAVATLLNGLELATGLDPGKIRLEVQIESAERPRQRGRHSPRDVAPDGLARDWEMVVLPGLGTVWPVLSGQPDSERLDCFVRNLREERHGNHDSVAAHREAGLTRDHRLRRGGGGADGVCYRLGAREASASH